jgi:hypothetical protein
MITFTLSRDPCGVAEAVVGRGPPRSLGTPDQRSDSLVIMAKKVVEVRECDRCGQEPAHQWTITGPEGTVRAIDLCERHGAPVANAFALAQPVANRRTRPSVTHRAPRPLVDLPPTPPIQPEPNWR